MTPTEFLAGWTVLLLAFLLVLWRLTVYRQSLCTHVWEPAGMGDDPDVERICVLCGLEECREVCPPHEWDCDNGYECVRCGKRLTPK